MEKISYVILFVLSSLLQAQFLPEMKQGEVRLNEIGKSPIYYYTGINKPTESFDYLQIAQRFELSVKNALLKDVTINRQVLNNTELRSTNFHNTKFRLYVYQMDLKTKGPGQKVNNFVIEISDKASENIKIDMKKYRLVIPTSVFFVGIEYIRNVDNERLTPVNEKNELLINMDTSNGKYITCYQPFIGMSPKQGIQINTWALTASNKWVLYDYFFPDLTDFAISATVSL